MLAGPAHVRNQDLSTGVGAFISPALESSHTCGAGVSGGRDKWLKRVNIRREKQQICFGSKIALRRREDGETWA